MSRGGNILENLQSSLTNKRVELTEDFDAKVNGRFFYLQDAPKEIVNSLKQTRLVKNYKINFIFLIFTIKKIIVIN